MTRPSLVSISAFAAFASLLWLSPSAAYGQATSAAAKTTTPRAANGHPDFSGFWNNASLTPFQRPAQFSGKQQFTSEEAAAFEQARLHEINSDRRDGGDQADLNRAYNEMWFDRGTKVSRTKRTSLIIDPPDGRVPPMTPAAQARFEKAEAEFVKHPGDGPEDRPLPDRCLMFSQVGPPMLPGNYNDNYQIVQTPDYVVILAEMGNQVRVIPLDGRPNLPHTVQQWMGVSRGHWEGHTLVVETTNFRFTEGSRFGVQYDGMTDQNLRIIERFTRTGPASIIYRATIDDPTVYTKPWTMEAALEKADGPIYEYACHEGNYAMVGILSGARAQEREAAKQKGGNR